MIIGEYSFLLMKQQFIWIIHEKIDEKKGEENIITSKNKGIKINVWGGINYNGRFSLHLFKENLNSERYI